MPLANKVEPFKQYIDKLNKYKDSQKEVLVENRDQKYTHSDIIRITYVGNRFALGKTVDYGIPYTLNYADMYANKGNTLKVRYRDEVFDE